MKTLRVKLRENLPYGKVIFDPVCPEAVKMVELLGQSTFTQANLDRLKQLGYVIIEVGRDSKCI